MIEISFLPVNQTEAEQSELFKTILTPEALEFVADLQHLFGNGWEQVRQNRAKHQKRINTGEEKLGFPKDEESRIIRRAVREDRIKITNIPKSLQDRRVELVTPAKPDMIVNAAQVREARIKLLDFEDAAHWDFLQTISGLWGIAQLTKGHISYYDPKKQKSYEFIQDSKIPVITKVRPNGFGAVPTDEILIDSKPIERGLFEFGIHFFHNAKTLAEKGIGPFYYLPKIEYSSEAALWNEVFIYAQNQLGLAQGTIKATPLIETLPASLQMEEIIFELALGDKNKPEVLEKLRNGETVVLDTSHIAGLNLGRHDYAYSAQKTRHNDPNAVWPQSSDTSMNDRVMKAVAEALIQICHSCRIHAIGGMAVRLPITDPNLSSAYEDYAKQVNEEVAQSVKADKTREAEQGFDGTWVAHPHEALLGTARKIMSNYMNHDCNQLNKKKVWEEIDYCEEAILEVPKGIITRKSFHKNILKSLLYTEAWLRGIGCSSIIIDEPDINWPKEKPIPMAMEDVATTERNRSELWTWIKHHKKLDDGTLITKKLFEEELKNITATIKILMEKGLKLQGKHSAESFDKGCFKEASDVLNYAVLSDSFVEFITPKMYEEYKKIRRKK